MPKFIAAIVAALCRLECQDRAALEAGITKSYEEDLAHFKLGLDTLRGMVEGKYEATLAELRQDVVIFLSSNLIVMVLALGVAVFRGAAARQLLPIPIVLTLATALASYWYVFGQNWVLTIIFSDYVGWSYLIFLAIIGLFLADIAFNRARVTSHLLSSLPSAIVPGPILPC